MTRRVSWAVWPVVAVGATLWAAGAARGQLAITEIMHNPGGVDALWEWIEVRNTSGSPLDLDGWVFDDNGDSAFSEANIRAANGNTIVPAGGVAVLYPGDELEFMPQRFTDAWGGGLTLIGVDGFTPLTATDVIGLWPSHGDYMTDAIPGATATPRRTFGHAAATINYSVGFPTAGSGRSIAWNGTGSVTDGANWVESEEGELGARVSVETTIESAQINSTDDIGNPGILPAGPVTPGLRITEIMFAPRSPLVTVDYAENDFEWVELFNNTGAAIDFASTSYVFDDDDGAKMMGENIESGMLAVGATGILFNSDLITAADMETMWGTGLNFIPVTPWPALNNAGGDTIAIWDSKSDYDSEPVTGSGRTHQNAVAALTYNTVAGQGWPTITMPGSFYLKNLTSDPNVGESWARSAANDAIGSRRPEAFFQSAVDHPGGDVGSPGFVPGAAVMPVAGDYDGNGTVDAADYAVWRNALGTSTTLPNDTTPGSVTPADYDVWRANFGRSAASGGLSGALAPEPAGALLMLFGFAGLTVTRRRSRPVLR